jgi:hypothetical protein
MAATTSQSTPPLAIVRKPVLGQKCSARASPVCRSLPRSFSNKKFLSSGGSRKGGEEPVAKLRSLSRSLSCPALVELSQDTNGIRRSDSGLTNSIRAQSVKHENRGTDGSSRVSGVHNKSILSSEIGTSTINGVTGYPAVNEYLPSVNGIATVPDMIGNGVNERMASRRRLLSQENCQ